MEIFNSIGGRLREVREDMQQTQSDFAGVAAAAGVPGATRQSQSKYEKGTATPSATYLAAIADEGADVLYILTGQRHRQAVKALPPDEQMLLDCYREWSPEVKKRELRRAMGLAPTGPDQTAPAMGNNNQVNSAQDAVQIKGTGNYVTPRSKK